MTQFIKAKQPKTKQFIIKKNKIKRKTKQLKTRLYSYNIAKFRKQQKMKRNGNTSGIRVNIILF